MSEIMSHAPTFFALYGDGRATLDDADDFVEAWHESGDAETRSLAEYLGMTDEEYGIWVITPRALPSILAARQAGRPLREFVEPFFDRLAASADPSDAPVLHALGHWLGRN